MSKLTLLATLVVLLGLTPAYSQNDDLWHRRSNSANGTAPVHND